MKIGFVFFRDNIFALWRGGHFVYSSDAVSTNTSASALTRITISLFVFIFVKLLFVISLLSLLFYLLKFVG